MDGIPKKAVDVGSEETVGWRKINAIQVENGQQLDKGKLLQCAALDISGKEDNAYIYMCVCVIMFVTWYHLDLKKIYNDGETAAKQIQNFVIFSSIGSIKAASTNHSWLRL